ncbi:hypothetical protein [Paraburkholderia sp. LEh10]|jgi:hypothetical protein|uniref:hypothetical protein n=1 Tax=Paraburkholderia sp. LEh10 TaxID=2821353 RepID=UPI001FD7AA8E|nr:hypothetical protein [Paraburkholderia sp. LEh10]
MTNALIRDLSSADAVNGAQLFDVAQTTANALGVGSTVNIGGTVRNPTCVIGGIKYFQMSSTLADSSATGGTRWQSKARHRPRRRAR